MPLIVSQSAELADPSDNVCAPSIEFALILIGFDEELPEIVNDPEMVWVALKTILFGAPIVRDENVLVPLICMLPRDVLALKVVGPKLKPPPFQLLGLLLPIVPEQVHVAELKVEP